MNSSSSGSSSSSSNSTAHLSSPFGFLPSFFSSHRNDSSVPSNSSTPSSLRPAFCQKRLEKEKRELLAKSSDDNIRLKNAENINEWYVELHGAEGTVYQNETFTLRFKFPERYPLDSPEVIFVGTPPIHPHVYSNGHICLSILYDGWSPALSVMSVSLSLISMLSSCQQKQKPVDDATYVRMAGSNVSPKHMKWIFHDDTV